MRKQFALTYMIGYDNFNAEFEQAVIRLASRLCGGCTVSVQGGFWMEDGAERKATFSGALHKERCLQIDLTTEPEKHDHVMRMMQAGIVGFAQRMAVNTDWVHVKSTEFEAHHFSVTEHNSKLSNRAMQVAAMSPETKASR